MSKEIYRFEPADPVQAGHSLKKKVLAVYKLEGFVEQTYRNVEDGALEPVWSYVKRGGQLTGIESTESVEDVLKKLRNGEAIKPLFRIICDPKTGRYLGKIDEASQRIETN